METTAIFEPQTLQAIGLLIRNVNFTFRETVDAALQEVGLSFGEISPMLFLVSHPGISGAQLARHNMVSAQAMNAVMKRLAAKGYVERRPHPESLRADSWHLTEDGKHLLDEARGVFLKVTSHMLSGFSKKDAENLEDYLRRCVTTLEDMGGDQGVRALTKTPRGITHRTRE